METTQPIKTGIPVSKSVPYPDFFKEIKEEISKEKMLLKSQIPPTQPNIIDIQFQVSDDSGYPILYLRIASTDDLEKILSYVVGKLERHSTLSQEFDLQHPSNVEKVDFYFMIQFPRK